MQSRRDQAGRMTSPFDSLTSRRALLLATLGGGLAAFLAACTGRSASQASSTPSPQSAPAAVSPTPASIATPACVVTPTETEGPYFVDEGLNRAEIATDPSDGSVRAGAPLSLTFVVARVSSTGCA